MTSKFDVAILGGGPAGASAGISLLQKGYSVVIIEKSSYSEIRIGETLPPQIKVHLAELKIPEGLLNHHIPCYANRSVWGSDSLSENNFFFEPYGNGWHLDRLQFDKQLISHAKKSGAKVFINSGIETKIRNEAVNWNVKFLSLGEAKTISARFAIDATGRNSVLVKNQGGKRVNFDHLISLVSFHEKQKAESNYTLVESKKNGWWYSADIPGNKIVMAFMTDADLYKKGILLKQNFWEQNLVETKFTKYRGLNNKCPVNLYAAGSAISNKRSGKNWFAIGDAAMSYDPLTSAGILKGIKDGCNAANALNDFFSGKKKHFKEFVDSFEKRFIEYLSERKKYHLLEKRWRNDPFWKRRCD